MRPQGFLQELQRGHLVTRLRHEALGYLPFGIDGAPKIVPLTVDRHEDLVEVPPPVARPHPRNPPLADLGCKQRTKSGPPEPDGLMADVVPSRVQQVLDGTKRQRVADGHHYRQADDLGACFKVSKSGVLGHLGRVGRVLPSPKPVWSDKALPTNRDRLASVGSLLRPAQDAPFSRPRPKERPRTVAICRISR